MDKQVLFVPGLFALGMLAGIAMMKSADDEVTSVPAAVNSNEEQPRQELVDVTDDESVERLLDRIDRLEQRLAVIEQDTSDDDSSTSLANTHSTTALLQSTVDTPVTSRSRPITADALVRAGVDSVTAQELVRRKNQLELDKLELRDDAIRGDYLGSSEYMEQLKLLMDAELSIRDEIGEDTYDRYLYSSGQANRIRVASVMIGSAAEQAGIQTGDLIVSYDGQRLFEYSELQRATSEGTRDEFVSITLNRAQDDLVVWAQRGPLGVRLSTTRVDPDR